MKYILLAAILALSSMLFNTAEDVKVAGGCCIKSDFE